MIKEKAFLQSEVVKEEVAFEAEIFSKTLERKLRRDKSSHYPILLQSFGESERVVRRNLILPRLEELDEMASAIDLLKIQNPQIFSKKSPESEIIAGWFENLVGAFSQLNRVNGPKVILEYPGKKSYRFWVAGWITQEDEDDEDNQSTLIHINMPYIGEMSSGKDAISTFIHEWLHHFFDEMELKDMTDAGKAIDEDHTEQFVMIEKKIGIVPVETESYYDPRRPSHRSELAKDR